MSMLRISFFSLLVLLLCICSLVGQDVRQNENKRIRIKFFDSNTGKAIYPKKIHLLDSNNTLLDVQQNYFLNKTNSDLIYSVPSNAYKLFIEEQGYESTVRRLPAIEDGDYNIYLSASDSNKKGVATKIESLLQDNKTLFTGYITDEDGQVIEGAEIRFENETKAVSNKEGYFEFYVEVPKTAYQEFTLLVSKPNYVLEERVISDLWSKGNWSLGIQLIEINKKLKTSNTEPIIINGFGATDKSNMMLKQMSCDLPPDIIVGNNCSGQSCSGPHLSFALDDYVKNVLPNEWFPSWLNDNSGEGGIEALKAGAVAIRTYAAWWVENPISPNNYDICNTTTCQVFVNGSATTATSNVVDIMEGYYLLDQFGNIMQTEFARETNNGSCGNGNFAHTRFGPPSNGGGCCGSGSGDVCFGQPLDPISHDRGMCQFGTVRWATGFTYPMGGGQGSAHGKGTKDWMELANYYYCNGFTINQCDTDCQAVLVLAGAIDAGVYQASEHVEALGIINSSSNVTMTGGNYVEWSTGFDGQMGSVVVGEVSPCN